jgi:hypothetical protein
MIYRWEIDITCLVYSIPVSNASSACESDATHSNIDNNGYQVIVDGGRRERGPSDAGFEVRSGDGNRQPHLRAGGTHEL